MQRKIVIRKVRPGDVELPRSHTPPTNSNLDEQYHEACVTPSDINEHVPTLARYASRCSTALELGVRSCVSSWGLLKGLKDNGNTTKALLAVDLERHPTVDHVSSVAAENGIAYAFAQGNDLFAETRPVDLTFIDTWHVYGQLKRELDKFAPSTRKYIIMHDTDVDGEVGESIRCGMNIGAQSKQTGIPEAEIRAGLKPAIKEFLESHPEWKLEVEYTNNNGLTILARMA